jgi:CheY-like chemotaxis protein
LNQDKRSLSLDSYQGKGEKILVVDDVLEQREIASMILTKLGYQVAAVSSGEEAVEYLKDHKVDLLILDMIMDPGMDGLDTYKKIIKINPDQKAIITSGFSENERVRKAESLGGCRYIKKPYTIENLGIAIKESLSRL